MKCEIIRDLLPSYIDGLTSNESNYEIEEHLETCQECKEILDQMKTEIHTESVEINKEHIKPFKKLNKRIFQSILITFAACILITGAYFYFFELGWKVDSHDMNIKYSFEDNSIQINFELTNGKVLNAWTDHRGVPGVITFTECYPSILDDRGEYPNQFSYGFCREDENSKMTFTENDCIKLHFKDKTETLYLKDIAEELGV